MASLSLAAKFEENKLPDLLGFRSEEINIMDHRPSVIAAATILVGIYQLTVEDLELKMSTIPFSGSLENEHIFSCFNLMQNIKELKAKSVQNSAKSANLRPTGQ
ncbi:hypothetical protein CJ030_MR0G026027 [Morella rubra]|uniref:Uncharacterized protein n=1 Tax=Morella rubra TaxID=262757 RepID=A0A6A1UFW7_9ROSI|nr:hypothetical protein CJ030_MR0G026027 [Morella rubra]